MPENRAETNRNKWTFRLGVIAIIIVAVAIQRYATGDGIAIDDSAFAQLYAARHLESTVQDFPSSYVTGKPLPIYPVLLALTAKLRHIEPVRAAAGVNAALMTLVALAMGVLLRRKRRLGDLWPLSAIALIVINSTFFAARVGPQILTACLTAISLLCLLEMRWTRWLIVAGVALFVMCALSSLAAILTLLLTIPLSIAARRAHASVRNAIGESRRFVFMVRCVAILIVAYVGLSLRTQLHAAALARRAPHRYGIAAWRESKTIRLLQLLPQNTPIYSNDPNAIGVLVDRTAATVPLVSNDAGLSNTGQDVLARMFVEISNQNAVIVWFTKDTALPVPKAALHAYLPPGDWIDLPDAKVFSAHDDSAVRDAFAKVHKDGYRADAAWTPSRRSAGRDLDWLKRHEEFCAIAAKGNIDLLFLGDSITDDVRQENKVPGGTAFFNDRFGKYHAANFGIDHDMTQHLLFRIVNGECPPSLSPKVAVILIGTNNAGEDSPEAIAHGVKACLDSVRKLLPHTKIILMGEFPRSAHADSEKRAILKKVNAIICKFDDGKTVRYLDIYEKFLDASGDLSTDMMYDLLHPSLKGYHIWFDALQPLLEEMMKRD